MATKPANPEGLWGQGIGGTFLAWGRYQPEGEELVPGWNPYGSYGANMCVTYHWMYPNEEMRVQAWPTADVRGADRIPVFADHTMAWIWGWKMNVSYEVEPPPCDAIPTGSDSGPYMHSCINRHDGGINATFLDWSVRKVGLKELWTLKWNRPFNTAGPWTMAGGVKPEDWPQWMRGFKDY
jgi:prepilin-type processing-associated H-X9-DG protein